MCSRLTSVSQNAVVINLSRYLSTTRIIPTEELRAPAYKCNVVESQKYDKWEESGAFKAEISSDKTTFSMVLPPPNVTGKLHLGHALTCTIQDVIVRRQRSLGYNVLWLPGMDHAGIATQGVVEKHLKNKNIDKLDLGREKFIDEVWKWKYEYGNTIYKQLRQLGCSLDWSREVFTMDSKFSGAVNTAFIQLFNKGLVYRKKALVNWCVKLKSTVSDIEVENQNIDGQTELVLPGYKDRIKFGLMYTFAYKVHGSDEEIYVSTTMPETMLGDTAIAVHPSDERFKHLHGKQVTHPYKNKTIPIIFDDFVNMNLGSGAVKITPAHSKIDYEVAKRHHLPLLQVIDEEGCMTNSGKFDKLKIYDCREVLIKDLDNLGLMKGAKPHSMTLPLCSKSGDVVIQLPKEQWFLSCAEINKRAEQLVKTGELKIIPENFVKNWIDWTSDDRDWCISRQLWWGHQIPAYKCSVDKDVVWIAAQDKEDGRSQASHYLRCLPEDISVVRDWDVLDTWFSSAVYPFASLGWPENNENYKKLYPLSLMVTGHDILGFWVHRMVILGLLLTEKIPFKNVLLHGIICDSNGAKMSKSKGNVIDPIDIMNGISMANLKKKTEQLYKSKLINEEELEKAFKFHKSNFSKTNGIPECGVDALRFTLLSQDTKSHFVGFDVSICYANKLFCNKIWQSIKYMQMSFNKLKESKEKITQKDLTLMDLWILSRMAYMVDSVNKNMEDYDFHLATKAIRKFLYNEFCDNYLEATKPGFENDNSKVGYAHAHTLSAVLNTSLRCLAPMMVYVTDELIPKIPAFEDNIVHKFDDLENKYLSFPQYADFKMWINPNIDNAVNNLLELATLIRQLKGLYDLSDKVKPSVNIETTDKDLKANMINYKPVISHLGKCGNVNFQKGDKITYVTAYLNDMTKVNLEIKCDDIQEVTARAKCKLQNKINKIEEALSRTRKKTDDKHNVDLPYKANSINEEKLLEKIEELKRLQRLNS